MTSFSQAANISTTLPTHVRVSCLTRSSCLPPLEKSGGAGAAACESNASLIPASPPDMTHLEERQRSSEAASWSATLVKYALSFLDEAAHNFGSRREKRCLELPSLPPLLPLSFLSSAPTAAKGHTSALTPGRQVPLPAPIRPSPPLISSLKPLRWTCHSNCLRTGPRLKRGGDNDSLRERERKGEWRSEPCEVRGQTSVLLILTHPHAAERSSIDCGQGQTQEEEEEEEATQRAALAVIHCGHR